MSGAMHESVTQTRGLDYRARRAVRLLAGDRLAAGNLFGHEFDRRIARAGDKPERLLILGGDRLADICHPGEIGVDAIRVRLARPEIEQHEIAASDPRV